MVYRLPPFCPLRLRRAQWWANPIVGGIIGSVHPCPLHSFPLVTPVQNNLVRCQLVFRQNYLALCLILLSSLVTSLYDLSAVCKRPRVDILLKNQFHPLKKSTFLGTRLWPLSDSIDAIFWNIPSLTEFSQSD